MLCCMNNVNESNFFLVVVFVFLFINSCSDNSINSSDDFDLSNCDNNDKVFTERFNGTFWQTMMFQIFKESYHLINHPFLSFYR